MQQQITETILRLLTQPQNLTGAILLDGCWGSGKSYFLEKTLLPQIKNGRTFDYSKATDGLRQILWGLFKKVVIADNCAEYANQIFNHSAGLSGSTLFTGALFFTFQIYCDFSGYSDMAIGIARLLGFNITKNFFGEVLLVRINLLRMNLA